MNLINIPVNITLASDERVYRIVSLLHSVLEQGIRIMAHLAKLQAEVEENKTVTESAITLLNGISEKLKAIAGDEAKVLELADELSSNSDALASAVAANTPAEDETE